MEIFNDLLLSPEPFNSYAEDLCKIDGIYRGGSRRMAEKYPTLIRLKPTTDYDFYIQDTVENRNKLSQYITGTFIDTHGYGDIDAACIFLLKDCQVVLRHDAAKYKTMFESLSGEFYRDYLWKSGPNKPSKDQIQAIINQLLTTMG